jgi:tetratricopeptide (TPR) repeat protein/4-amino-4-deoxy-L-arabinose transferase-like glycosyltransferase
MVKRYVKENFSVVLICLLFAVLGLLRLNDLSILNPDSARYLIIGNSLAHGKGFVDDTQPDPDRFVVHAPLYPILTAPVQIIFPMSLTAVKIWTLMWGVATIVLLYVWLLRHFSKRGATVGALLLAFNPLMLVYSTEVLSEAPFLAFMLVFLIAAERLSALSSVQRRDFAILLTAVTGVMLLREVGLAVVLAATLFFVQRKEYSRAVIVFLVPVGLFFIWYLRNHYWIGPLPPGQSGNIDLILQHFVTPPNAPLVNEFALRIALRMKEYGMHLLGMLFYPLYITMQFKLNLFPSQLHILLQEMMVYGRYVVVAVMIPILIRGIYIDIRSSSGGVLKVNLTILYLLVTFLYPVYDVRFLLPVLIIFIYYVVVALKSFKFTEFILERNLIIALALIALIPNFSHIYEIIKLNMAYQRSPIAFYNGVRHLPQYPLMFTQPWSLLGRWIRENIPDTFTFASSSKDIVPFIGNRKVAEIDQGVPLPVFETLLRDNNVSYLVVPTRLEGMRVFEFSMRESNRFAFDSVVSIANLNLLRVRNRLREGDNLPIQISAVEDSAQATYYLFKGRKELKDGRYESAYDYFSRAYSIDSLHPELLFQSIVAHAVAGDSAGAHLYYNRLFRLPQSLGYTMPARLQLEAMNMLSMAMNEKYFMSKAVEMGKAADLYWRLGYKRRAADIMNALYNEDTTYFMGLLWGLDYNLQLGDTLLAKRYLSSLKGTDSGNAVVLAFNRILSYGDSLNMSSDAHDISRYHTQIGYVYRQIELNEEAIDEAERALHFDSGNLQALLLLGEQFERKNNLRMAIRYYQSASVYDPSSWILKTKLDSLGYLRGR